jgi:hypothetical protein
MVCSCVFVWVNITKSLSRWVVQGAHEIELIALVMLPAALLMCGYALLVYNWRTSAIRNKTALYYDDRRCEAISGCLLISI